MHQVATFFASRDILTLGLTSGDTVLVHSSMKAMGTLLTPEEVLDTLEEEGTLLIPALAYENFNAAHPVFDSDKTGPCIGLLPVCSAVGQVWSAA